MPLFAHSLAGKPQHTWEPLSHHLSDVGHLARRFAAPFGAADVALAAGLLHDIGKTSPAFQAYISGSGAERGPDHSTAGAVEAMKRYGDCVPGLARLIAFAIAGHHAGLADGSGHRGGSLQMRLEKCDLPNYDGWETEVGELPVLHLPAWPRFDNYRAPAGYAEAFLGRMLFSCLVDADFLATEAFYARASGVPTDRGDPTPLAELRERLDRHLAELVAVAQSSPLNSLRADILAHARGKAADAPGLFTMTVPTGGGKTLASLAFALDHAIAHGLDRVIYVIPYTGAWIETRYQRAAGRLQAVAPRAGAWIETRSRSRAGRRSPVAPRAGAWIETCTSKSACPSPSVAPRAGAWIETPEPSHEEWSAWVAPRAGAWIETAMASSLSADMSVAPRKAPYEMRNACHPPWGGG